MRPEPLVRRGIQAQIQFHYSNQQYKDKHTVLIFMSTGIKSLDFM